MPAKAKSVWETLSVIDCNDHTEEKNGFTYLSWAWAWKTLKEHYPTARFEKHPVQHLPNGTAMIACRVWIDDVEDVTEVFPVIDYKNKAIPNPDAFQINTAYQRCLVKCLAYMGLGMYIYQGEKDNPDSTPLYEVKKSDGTNEVVEDLTTLAQVFITFMDGNDLDGLRKFWALNKGALEHLEALDPENYKRVLDAFTEKANTLKGDDNG